MDVEITELEKIDATRVDGVLAPANGIPILLMKSVEADDVEKDWADWDAAHEGAGRPAGSKPTTGDSKASAADAVARAKSTIAAHKAGKKVSAADLKNAHDVHEAHLAHEAKLKAEGKAPAAAKPKAATAKPAAAKPAAAKPAATSKKELAKGERDCPKCDKSYDADHAGSKCENCGTDLPDAPAAKSIEDWYADMERPDWYADAAALVKKAMVRGKVDESADIDGGQQAIALVGKLIGYEAQELAAGNLGETADIELLSSAASLLRAWVTGESAVQDGNVMPATMLMQSAAKGRDYSAAERKEMADDGRALPDGSYPIADEHDLNSAAILARSGHGDAAAAAKHIGKRARELGVPNPLGNGEDAAKAQIAKEGTDVDTVDQTGGLSKAVEEAVAKAVAPIEKLRRELEETLAKVKATPVPGGPVLSRNVQVKITGGISDDVAAKAALYREKATLSVSPADREGYLALARKTEQEARTAALSA